MYFGNSTAATATLVPDAGRYRAVSKVHAHPQLPPQDAGRHAVPQGAGGAGESAGGAGEGGGGTGPPVAEGLVRRAVAQVEDCPGGVLGSPRPRRRRSRGGGRRQCYALVAQRADFELVPLRQPLFQVGPQWLLPPPPL